MVRYNEVSEFISSNHRNPSKCRRGETYAAFHEKREKIDIRRGVEGTEVEFVQGVVGVE